MTWLQHRVLLFPKHEEHVFSFKGPLFNFLQCCLQFCYCQWVSWYFFLWLKAVTGSFWKIFFSNLLTDSMFQFFWKILMFGKNRLNVIIKRISVLIGVSFLLPFISSFLSSFSTVLMCLSNSSELYPCSRNRCLSSLQWCLKSFEVVWICLILSASLYEILSFNDFGCSEFIWRRFYLFYFYFIFNLFYFDDKIEYNLVYLCNNS